MKNKRIRNAAALLLAALLMTVLFAMTAAAAESAESQLYYVTDMSQTLTEDEISELETLGQAVSEKYNCGVYAILLDDYKNYTDGSLADFNRSAYEEYSLGLGEDRNAVILSISMADRDYDIMSEGELANASFNEAGKQALSEAFLDDFKNSSWSDGLKAYFNECDTLLAEPIADTAAAEAPSASHGIGFAGILIRFILIPFGIAGIVCRVLNGKMRDVAAATQAKQYVAEEGMKFTIRKDDFTKKTEERKQPVKAAAPQTPAAKGPQVKGGGSAPSHSSGKF